MLVKFEQSCMVKIIQNFVLLDKKKQKKRRKEKKKKVNIFWQSADAILEDVSMTEIIVWF